MSGDVFAEGNLPFLPFLRYAFFVVFLRYAFFLYFIFINDNLDQIETKTPFK